MSQKDKGRQFFQQMQPTFSIELPKNTVTKLEFLDHSDPDKDTVVRKKAREWVNKNKATSKHNRHVQWLSRAKMIKGVAKEADETRAQLEMIKREEFVIVLDPHSAVNTKCLDPFNLLPDIGRNYDHILHFFLALCPDEIPCSDDKYSDLSKHALVPFSSDNTVLGNMAKHEASFILWLYATALVRAGVWGRANTEELRWFYGKTLTALQDVLKKETESGEYSDHLLNCLSCITATACCSGMFQTAEVHRDALIRVLTLRGGGDIVKGIQSATPWTFKAVQWCEIVVAAQLVQVPKIPYLPYVPSSPAPKQAALEAARLTSITLASLPHLSEPLHKIIHLLHHLGIAHARPPVGKKIDTYVIQPLYDAEYALLQILAAQKIPGHGFSVTEVLLAEAFQLYFWTGPRTLPLQTRVCDLLLLRTRRALLPLLCDFTPDSKLENMPTTTSTFDQVTQLILENTETFTPRPSYHSQETQNAIIWSLALGSVVSISFYKSEYSWFKAQLSLELQAVGLDKSEQRYQDFLNLFPATDGFPSIDLRTLYAEFDTKRLWELED
ncbi:uncharacterized protein K460DRAFT_294785 [Cucurbitaria berberidis CBS 394.84]|uniref:Transcription factor domain-containing protein n=1 Tax=Cucurbitaria berberidis CBS 394.84 TaxID=1168544 RepID=A0A9P4G873_9PLEO|nr:uncharacterized protein K460DRAFT_294785 [Cucurbitaria berberidis CBS 394.84]KAF1840827.1 hypothetical protein K460DRAFT_294785 [Cucurbitaria berberidis CBS 394.84]